MTNKRSKTAATVTRLDCNEACRVCDKSTGKADAQGPICTACAGPDFLVQNEGSIFLLIPQNGVAQTWVDDNLPDGTLTFGNGYAVEHRYIASILDGITNYAGLTVAGR